VQRLLKLVLNQVPIHNIISLRPPRGISASPEKMDPPKQALRRSFVIGPAVINTHTLAPILWSQRKHAYERKLACAGSALCARGRRVGIRGCKGKWETHTPMVARFPQYTIYLNQICAFRGLLNGSFLENLM
jgi:hypothetical protein